MILLKTPVGLLFTIGVAWFFGRIDWLLEHQEILFYFSVLFFGLMCGFTYATVFGRRSIWEPVVGGFILVAVASVVGHVMFDTDDWYHLVATVTAMSLIRPGYYLGMWFRGVVVWAKGVYPRV